MELQALQQAIRTCTLCADHLPLGPRPVVAFEASSRLLIVGQAPGTKVHASGIPWDDASGERLRRWMAVDTATFYDPSKVAITAVGLVSLHSRVVPMGFCYPGRGKSGDLPPRPECAPQWHQAILQQLPNVQLTLLIGQYAQRYYLGNSRKKNLTTTVQHYADYLPDYFPLVHPSPRNQYWMQRHPWFEGTVVPALQERVRDILAL